MIRTLLSAVRDRFRLYDVQGPAGVVSLTYMEFRVYCVLPDCFMPGRAIAHRYRSYYERGVSYGALYPTLRRLVEKGLVVRVKEEVPRGLVMRFKAARHERSESR